MDKARIESLKNLIKYVKPSAGKVKWEKFVTNDEMDDEMEEYVYSTSFKPKKCKRTSDGYYSLELDPDYYVLTVSIRKEGVIRFGFDDEETILIKKLSEEISEWLKAEESSKENDLLAKINVDLADLKMPSD